MGDEICYVVGAGENYRVDFQPAAEDLVIAADAGMRYLEEQGIRTENSISVNDGTLFIVSQEKQRRESYNEKSIEYCRF